MNNAIEYELKGGYRLLVGHVDAMSEEDLKGDDEEDDDDEDEEDDDDEDEEDDDDDKKESEKLKMEAQIKKDKLM